MHVRMGHTMETTKETIAYCENMGKDIEQLDGMEFIDEYLVNEQFLIHKITNDDTVYIDLLSGINYYGETAATIEVHPDNSFKVERFGISVDVFQSDDLYDTVMDVLQDLIHYDDLTPIDEVRYAGETI